MPGIFFDPYDPRYRYPSPSPRLKKSNLYTSLSYYFNGDIRYSIEVHLQRKLTELDKKINLYLIDQCKKNDKKQAFQHLITLLEIQQPEIVIDYLRYLLSERWFKKTYFSSSSDAENIAIEIMNTLSSILYSRRESYVPFRNFVMRRTIEPNEIKFFKVLIAHITKNNNNVLEKNLLVYLQCWFNLFLIRHNVIMDNHLGGRYGSFDRETYSDFYNILLRTCEQNERNALKKFSEKFVQLNTTALSRALNKNFIRLDSGMCDDEDYAERLKGNVQVIKYLVG